MFAEDAASVQCVSCADAVDGYGPGAIGPVFKGKQIKIRASWPLPVEAFPKRIDVYDKSLVARTFQLDKLLLQNTGKMLSNLIPSKRQWLIIQTPHIGIPTRFVYRLSKSHLHFSHSVSLKGPSRLQFLILVYDSHNKQLTTTPLPFSF